MSFIVLILLRLIVILVMVIAKTIFYGKFRYYCFCYHKCMFLDKKNCDDYNGNDGDVDSSDCFHCQA